MLSFTCCVHFYFYFILCVHLIHMQNPDNIHRVYTSWCLTTDLAKYAVDCAMEKSEIQPREAAELLKALVSY